MERRNLKIMVVLAVIGTALVSGCTTPPVEGYSSFAQCLTDSGVTEYGAYWCSSCSRVKRTLGDAWQKIDYVECDLKCVPDSEGVLPDYCNGFESQTDLCLEMGIVSLPSWVKNGEIIYTGSDLNGLADATGCQLPE